MNKNTYIASALVLASVILLSACGKVAPSVPAAPTTPQPLSLEDAREIKAQVEELITLGGKTEPVVALIFNADDLRKEQPFYQNAKNGDVLLIYPDIAKAVIYDPAADKLVNVGPVMVDPPKPTEDGSAATPTPAATKPATTPKPAPTSPSTESADTPTDTSATN